MQYVEIFRIRRLLMPRYVGSHHYYKGVKLGAIRVALVGVILLLTMGCNSPDSMFAANVSSQTSRVRNLEYGQISCMHCPMYFKFECDKSFVNEIIRDHALVRVDSFPKHISLMLRMIDVPWWISGKEIDASEKFLIEYDSPRGGSGEPRIRLALVNGGTVYFVTNGYYSEDKQLKTGRRE